MGCIPFLFLLIFLPYVLLFPYLCRGSFDKAKQRQTKVCWLRQTVLMTILKNLPVCLDGT